MSPSRSSRPSLALRINAILRRTIAAVAVKRRRSLTFGPFTFNSARGELAARRRDGASDGSRGRAAAHSRFARPGEVISREELGEERTGAGLERSVDVQVTRLRRKMEARSTRAPVFLQTVRGMSAIRLRGGLMDATPTLHGCAFAIFYRRASIGARC
jgi:two-component system phosphate regulon response regulator OmpR